jgi:hypothetical protein
LTFKDGFLVISASSSLSFAKRKVSNFGHIGDESSLLSSYTGSSFDASAIRTRQRAFFSWDYFLKRSITVEICEFNLSLCGREMTAFLFSSLSLTARIEL